METSRCTFASQTNDCIASRRIVKDYEQNNGTDQQRVECVFQVLHR